MNWRIKPLDAILASAEKRSLTRSLGAFQLTMLGVGAIIGTGIFVLTAEAAQKAGPGMMASFVIAGFVCAVTALCYAELAAMVPVSGSAYTYSYAVLGELIAWIVGWALILEYTIAASAVSVGWSNYFVPLIAHSFDIHIPLYLSKGYFAGGLINVPAMFIAALVTTLLALGTRESATVNAVLVCIKVTALVLFCALALPVIKTYNFEPFAPLGALGIGGAAASIFFAYVGFDAVSTAAEETKNPTAQHAHRPDRQFGHLHDFLSAGRERRDRLHRRATGAGCGGQGISPGGPDMLKACMDPAKLSTLVCSDEPLAHVLREIGWPKMARLIGLGGVPGLPSVILMMMFGQTRVFFSMARDRLVAGRSDQDSSAIPHASCGDADHRHGGDVRRCVSSRSAVWRTRPTAALWRPSFSVAMGVMILRRTAKDRKTAVSNTGRLARGPSGADRVSVPVPAAVVLHHDGVLRLGGAGVRVLRHLWPQAQHLAPGLRRASRHEVMRESGVQ